MSNKDYYARWLKIKESFNQTLADDARLQELAVGRYGLKPQATAVELVARIYCRYCKIFNELCDCYDQMEQVQRRPYIKKVIDAVTCRILEVKSILEDVEVFEFTYPENALQQMLIIPQDIQIICPFFYPFEIRQQEMQYIIDEIFAGHRIGDPSPTSSEIERREEERLEQENIKREEKEAEIKRKLAMGEDIEESVQEQEISPEEMANLLARQEYETHVNNIQRMERSRRVIREKVFKFNKDTNLYLELAGLKKPPAKEVLRLKAAKLIQSTYRKYMTLKREHLREYKLRLKLDMIIPASSAPSAKIKLEDVKAKRREFRLKYYDQWMKENAKENARILKLKEGDIMEDISAEIRQWFREWYDGCRLFDEYPFAEEGGSVLIVRGETFTIEEFIEWRQAEDKRLKAEASAPKSKDQIKAEKLAARLEKKRMELEAKEKEQKRLIDYKKSRLKPENDPGIYMTIGNMIEPLQTSWNLYQNQWKSIETPDAPINVLKGFINELVTESAYQDVQLSLRPIVDELMRLELNLLKNSLKFDYAAAGISKPPQSKKRKKPRKVKAQKPDKVSPAAMFQCLVDEGIVRKYPKTTLDDFWGDLNYAAADLRAILWTPRFPPPCLGDVREQARTRCLLTLGCSCENAARVQLIVGPKATGKRTLINAIATEANAILIDLSPMNVYNKFPGPKNLKMMFQFVVRISKLMQPTVILVDNADKMFYKKVPKEEKMFDPTRLSRDFYKEVIKPISFDDKILVLGTASEPWLAKGAPMYKAFPSVILIPRTDYASISLSLSKILMRYHGIKCDFNLHSAAQVLRGYDMNSIRTAIQELMNGRRVAALYYKPLQPMEVLNSVLECKTSTYMSGEDYSLFKDWYNSYSPWGKKYYDYMLMLESQWTYKQKAEKKKK